MIILPQKNTYGYSSLFLLISLSLFSFIKTDLPSHCLVSDIIGKWEFMIEDKQFSPSLKDEQTTCGHGFPNKVSKEIGDISTIPFHSSYKISFLLKSDYKVYQDTKQIGTWTPVYDQSFIINYHNSIITASYKYYLSTKDKTTYETNCGKTMVGWIIKDKDQLQSAWSCVVGIRVVRLGVGEDRQEHFLKKTMLVQRDIKEVKVKVKGINKALLYQVRSDDLSEMIDEINHEESGMTWKAKMYSEYKGLNMIELREKLGMNIGKGRLPLEMSDKTKTKMEMKQSAYSLIEKETIPSEGNISKEDFVYTYDDFMKRMNNPDNILPDEANDNTDAKPSKVPSNNDNEDNDNKRDQDSQYVTNPSEIKKYINTPLDQINENQLPLNWDWRNVGGTNYITPIETQGNCGSCYVFSTISSLESRLRIQTDNKDQTHFSIQFPLSCNFYSEGCSGGFPYHVAKFFSEFEIIPRDCFRYTQSNSKCSKACDYAQSPKKYTVSDYGYIGGFYGATNEAMMMKEIRARGPIPGNIKVPIPFNFYSSGIFSMGNLSKSNVNVLNKTRMVDRNLSYETVEHSITLVGYGVENGRKYWIGKNTWGEQWGERGFFKILRGENEQNIESMGEYFNIKVSDR